MGKKRDTHLFFMGSLLNGNTSLNRNGQKVSAPILKERGTRKLDKSMARHCGVAVVDDPAFIFYHVEPWRRYELEKKKGRGPGRTRIFDQPLKNRESVMQMAGLELENGNLYGRTGHTILRW